MPRPAPQNPEAALWEGRFVVLITYTLAGLLGALIAHWIASSHGYAASWWVHGVATLTVFAASVRFDNTSLYDPYWSVLPGGVILAWVGWYDLPGDPVRAVAVAVIATLWSVRLTLHWARGWPGLHHEDWRYQRFRAWGPTRYWLVSLFGLHGFPTLLVGLGGWAAWRALATPGAPLNLWDALAFAVGIGSVALEHVADEQAGAFRRQRTDPEEVLRSGLWARSRHPNYLGEIGFWTSLSLFAIAADWRNAATLVGPAAMFLLFRYISIPMMERRQIARKPGYVEYVMDVPMLFPLPQARRTSPLDAFEDRAPDTSAGDDAPVRGASKRGPLPSLDEDEPPPTILADDDEGDDPTR